MAVVEEPVLRDLDCMAAAMPLTDETGPREQGTWRKAPGLRVRRPSGLSRLQEPAPHGGLQAAVYPGLRFAGGGKLVTSAPNPVTAPPGEIALRQPLRVVSTSSAVFRRSSMRMAGNRR